MSGPGFSLQKLMEAIKKEKPISMAVGSHHYVQISEMDISLTGLEKEDLSSVLSIHAVGDTVPEITFSQLQHIFPNLKVTIN